jgi:hypothetical protein
MEATFPKAIAVELNGTMLGRCVLAHAEGFDDGGDPHHWPDRLRQCMAQVFESLAAEITVMRQAEPALSAEDFARFLLAEANFLEDEQVELDPEEDEDPPEEWHTHPSLTPAQRNLWS